MKYEIGDNVVIHEGASNIVGTRKNYDGQIGEITGYLGDEMYEVKFSDGGHIPLLAKRFAPYKASELTLRDRVALVILPVLMARNFVSDSESIRGSFELADEWLVAREKEK